SARLRPGRPPLRLAQLSDMHLRRLRPRHRRMVQLVAERRPHLLFLTGDILGRDDRSQELCKELLSELRAEHGVFACRGNREVRSLLRVATLRRAMAGWGVELLVNEHRDVRTDAGVVRVAAVDDLSLGWPSFAEALDGGADAPDYTVLLSHAPLAARFIGAEDGVDLLLSGHTHGGQIRIPLLWRAVLPACTGPFHEGLYETDWGHVYVNRGFGTAPVLPLRWRCPAELTFFEVRPA
ncbi:MAG: hypothetical protein AMK73_08390, partial [Planctomycetes bacterium SM23_32]